MHGFSIGTLYLCLVVMAFSPNARGQDASDSGDAWTAFSAWAKAEFGAQGARAAEFLATHRPDRDAAIAVEILQDNLRFALRARAEMPWAQALDEATFFNDVLPYAVLDETRENWRPAMYARAKPLVVGCGSAVEAAQALNEKLFDTVGVHYSTKRERPNQSPAESIRQGMASCTGLSILLVDACRSVGVPARIVGVAQWNKKRGNHTWVEVFDGERWCFTGADEYDAQGLNRAWFVADAQNALAGHPTKAVKASSFRPTGDAFIMVWSGRDQSVHGVDVTARYATPSGDSEDGRVKRYLRVWRGESRIAAPVRVYGSDGKLAVEVVTKDGRADLNDMPFVELLPGADYRIEVDFGVDERQSWLRVDAADDVTVDLRERELSWTREAAEEFVVKAWTERVAARKEGAEAALARGSILVGETELRFRERTFGEAPKNGHSLWISMHGGGGAPARVNDGQWRNQIRLYEPDEGIYVAPRAPTDTWNLWHQDHIDPLFDELIASYVTARGVDPERVYLMGYSAGGDGVYQLAPRMADRFAAASMMAGHPNETTPAGLRNLPFAIFMGGKDGAYDRNKIAAQWQERLAALRSDDPDGYSHRVTIYPEFGHWMEGRDKEALPWMSDMVRRAWPKKVVWRQDDVIHTRFYWLAVDAEHAAAGAEVVAEVDGQTIRIRAPESVPGLTLRLRDTLLDLDQPILVELDGDKVFEGTVPRTREAVEASLEERFDLGTAATALLRVSR